jgi:pimeloyl-ACP methyl ester carboxylesterase
MLEAKSMIRRDHTTVILAAKSWVFVLLLPLMWGCGDDKKTVNGPSNYPDGPGIFYPIERIVVGEDTDVPIGTTYGHFQKVTEDRPAIILLHDFGQNSEEWFFTNFFIDLLQADYVVVAINLRGHGNTPLPDGRDPSEYALGDLDNSYLDVQTTLDWLVLQPGVDKDRIGVIGTGFGANVAYVAKGVFPTRIQTAVALSPIFWESPTDSSRSLAVGDGLPSFTPQSTLFIVGEVTILLAQTIRSSVAFANELAAVTADPVEVETVSGNPVYGLEMLCDESAEGCNPVPRERLLRWLEDNL